jgi:ethanolamine utilization cobalamin adenosyltransferase
MQQDLEDEKNEAAIKDLENKVESYKAALEKKDFVIHCAEGSLAEAQAEIDKLNSELLIKSEKSQQEKQNLETNLKTEIEKNSNLQKSLKELQEKCKDFGNRCV